MNKLILCFLFLSLPSFAEDENKSPENSIEKSKEKKEERSFVIAPGPTYSPQLKFGINLIAMKLFRFDKEDKKTPPSTIGGMIAYTTNETWYGGAFSNLYLKKDRWRSLIAIFRGDFYGEMLHYETGRLLDTKSDVKGLMFNLRRRVYDKTYLGAGIVHNQIDFEAQDVPKGEPDSNTALHVIGEYDSRDNTFTATSGIYFQPKLNIYRESLGSDDNFENLQLTYSHYKSVGKEKNNIFSWIVDLNFNFGPDRPNYNYAYGRAGAQRGYTGSVYEGKNMMRVEGEYKHFYQKVLDGRLGNALFAGLGTIYGGVSKIGNPLADSPLDSELLPHAGVGVRYKLIPEQNLNSRLDFAYGREKEFTMYFSLREAI